MGLCGPDDCPRMDFSNMSRGNPDCYEDFVMLGLIGAPMVVILAVARVIMLPFYLMGLLAERFYFGRKNV